MPEIKHTFIGGKMNKDLDERLIPKDGYVDAMNIQVSTSEESDVGTAQNLLGNREVPSGVNMTDAITVASIADEKRDKDKKNNDLYQSSSSQKPHQVQQKTKT